MNHEEEFYEAGELVPVVMPPADSERDTSLGLFEPGATAAEVECVQATKRDYRITIAILKFICAGRDPGRNHTRSVALKTILSGQSAASAAKEHGLSPQRLGASILTLERRFPVLTRIIGKSGRHEGRKNLSQAMIESHRRRKTPFVKTGFDEKPLAPG